MKHLFWLYHPVRNPSRSTDILSLGSLIAGDSGIVVKISGDKTFISRMHSMGFSLGTEVTVLQNYNHDPVLAYVRNSRIALGRSESEKIIVHQNEP